MLPFGQSRCTVAGTSQHFIHERSSAAIGTYSEQDDIKQHLVTYLTLGRDYRAV
jgi:hypothetical protein